MNYIYTNTRNNRQYVLDPQITMGEKVCLVDMATCEDKFVSPKTLKAIYWDLIVRCDEKMLALLAWLPPWLRSHTASESVSVGQL